MYVAFLFFLTLFVFNARQSFALVAFSSAQFVGKIPFAYYITSADMNNDGLLDMVALGMRKGEIVWYENMGINRGHNACSRVSGSCVKSVSFREHVVGFYEEAVHLTVVDMNQDGYQDIVVAHHFGKCPDDCTEKDGQLSWLQNPGLTQRSGESAKFSLNQRSRHDLFPSTSLWKSRDISLLGSPSSGYHRVEAYIRAEDNSLRILGVPNTGLGSRKGDGYMNSPIHLVSYIPGKPDEWHRNTIDTIPIHVLHDIKPLFGFGSRFSPSWFALCSQEGITWMDVENTLETTITIHEGYASDDTFSGCSSLAIGKLPWIADDVGFMATIEPFHGGMIAVYLNRGTYFERHLIDEKLAGGHDVHIEDIDGDGMPDIIVSFRGPENRGVYWYRCEWETALSCLPQGKLATDAGSSTHCIGDFNNDSSPDIATIGWGALNDEQVEIFYNLI